MGYNEFIELCKNAPVVDHDRSQWHHIIPRCIGGTDTEDNLIELSWEDHWMAHQLLALEHPDMKYLVRIAKKSLESWIKNCEALSKQKGDGHPRFGTHSSEETKEKISESMRGNTNVRGKHWTWSKPRKLKSNMNESTRGKVGRPKGFHMSEESRKKTSESMKGNKNGKGKHWKWHEKEKAHSSCEKHALECMGDTENI